jgi:hypothetical protein
VKASGVGIEQDVAEGGAGGGLTLMTPDQPEGLVAAITSALSARFGDGAVGRTMRRAPSCHRWLRDSLGRGNERAYRQRWS